MGIGGSVFGEWASDQMAKKVAETAILKATIAELGAEVRRLSSCKDCGVQLYRRERMCIKCAAEPGGDDVK